MEPVLWHITISHFNEKVRWALEFKEISYRARAPLPGMHMAVALFLTRGRQYTFPVIDFGDERVGGSTAIIDALDRLLDRYGGIGAVARKDQLSNAFIEGDEIVFRHHHKYRPVALQQVIE